MDKEKQEQWNDATLQILESLHKAIDGLHYQNSILKQMLDIMDNRLNRLEKSGSKIESDSAAAPRYVLNGIFFSLKDYKMTMVATDGGTGVMITITITAKEEPGYALDAVIKGQGSGASQADVSFGQDLIKAIYRWLSENREYATKSVNEILTKSLKGNDN